MPKMWVTPCDAQNDPSVQQKRPIAPRLDFLHWLFTSMLQHTFKEEDLTWARILRDEPVEEISNPGSDVNDF